MKIRALASSSGFRLNVPMAFLKQHNIDTSDPLTHKDVYYVLLERNNGMFFYPVYNPDASASNNDREAREAVKKKIKADTKNHEIAINNFLSGLKDATIIISESKSACEESSQDYKELRDFMIETIDDKLTVLSEQVKDTAEKGDKKESVLAMQIISDFIEGIVGDLKNSETYKKAKGAN